eukprot:tig00000128_g7201.t1
MAVYDAAGAAERAAGRAGAARRLFVLTDSLFKSGRLGEAHRVRPSSPAPPLAAAADASNCAGAAPCAEGAGQAAEQCLGLLGWPTVAEAQLLAGSAAALARALLWGPPRGLGERLAAAAGAASGGGGASGAAEWEREEREVTLLLVPLYIILLLYEGEVLGSMHYSLRYVRLVLREPDAAHYVVACTSMYNNMRILGLWRQAAPWLAEAEGAWRAGAASPFNSEYLFISKTIMLTGAGELDAAEAVAREGLAWMRESSCPGTECYLLVNYGHVALLRGRLAEADAAYAAAAALSRKIATCVFAAMALLGRAECVLAGGGEGRRAEALVRAARAEFGDDDFRSLKGMRAQYHALLATALFRQSRFPVRPRRAPRHATACHV